MKLILRVVLIGLAVASPIHAQSLKPGEWRSYTSMRDVRAIAVAGDGLHLWAATGGGAFRVSLRDPGEPIVALRTTDGLSENDLTAVASDGGDTYLGGRTGAFDVYHSSKGTIEKLGSDIQHSGYPGKAINSFAVNGDSIIIATAYGLEVYRKSGAYYATTVAQLGSNAHRGDSVRQAIVAGGYIFAALPSALASAPKDSDLPTPSSWSLTTDSVGLVMTLASLGGNVCVGTSTGLYTVSANRLSLVRTSFHASIDRLATSGDTLYILDSLGNVTATHDLQNFTLEPFASTLGSHVNALSPAPYVTLVLGTSSSGIGYSAGDSIHTSIFPAGPISNTIADLYFSSATDKLYLANKGDGIGLFQPDSEKWTNYRNDAGVIPNVKWENIFYDSVRDVTWLMTTGDPIVLHGIGGASPSFQTIDVHHNGLPTSDYKDPNSEFLSAPGQPILDNSGRIVLTSYAGQGEALSVMDPGTTYHFTNYKLIDAYDSWGCVTQDHEGNFWAGGFFWQDAPAPAGVSWHNMSTHAYGNIAGGSGHPLASNYVNALLTDQDDEIWCGTSYGLQIISNPYAILEPNPDLIIRPVDFLKFQIIHAMATDGVGNKWIGTENGIFVVSPDGSDSVAHFTKENSPLIDNTIYTIALDPGRGEAYAGTPSGISRFSTLFKQGKPDYSQIRVYPNPIVQTRETSPTVYIDGLVAGSTVKIFTLDRKLVASINGTNLGSIVTWNGRDDLGRQVTSGEYLVTATSPQASDNGAAKLVIIGK
ncbi:MAG: hypothetical protein Q8902_14625 [Bacteroidota bacterium]|nr:hypothetical protein [Bacteroidota bacterium]MDP4234483.1 hypothetical protein [Bacteroidota bacterium]MDP4243868.1 hypothetical protein [Bacteroidota bacterium]